MPRAVVADASALIAARYQVSIPGGGPWRGMAARWWCGQGCEGAAPGVNAGLRACGRALRVRVGPHTWALAFTLEGLTADASPSSQ